MYRSGSFSSVRLLSHEVVRPLHIEQPAVDLQKVIELNDEEKAVCLLATSADGRLSLGDHRAPVYRNEAPQLGSVHSSSAEKRTQPPSMMTIKCQSKRTTRTSPDGERAEAGAKGATMKKAVDEKPPASGALRREAGLARQVLELGITACSLVRDTSFNELDDFHELVTGSALHWIVSLALADPLYGTRRAQGQNSSTHDVSCK